MIERLKELLSEGSPGPWAVDGLAIKTTAPKRLGFICDFRGRKYLNQAFRDQHLIVNAINALPELIDRLERAEARGQELERRLAIVAKNASHRLGGECGACKHEYTGEPCHYETHQDCTKCWHDYLIGNTKIVEPNCFMADGSGRCLGYSSENDDEPIDMCKKCPRYTSYTNDQ